MTDERRRPLRFKAYRDRDEMERDRMCMEAAGWRLRAWKVRGVDGELQGPPESYGLYPYVVLGGGCLFAAAELARLAVWAACAAVMLPMTMIKGRKRIDAAYERDDATAAR